MIRYCTTQMKALCPPQKKNKKTNQGLYEWVISKRNFIYIIGVFLAVKSCLCKLTDESHGNK